MSRVTAYAASLLAVLALLHCAPEKVAGGAGVGNPPQAEVALSVEAGSTTVPALAKTGSGNIGNPDGPIPVKDSAGVVLHISGIRFTVGRIEFRVPEGRTCADVQSVACEDGEISLPGPYRLDLMTGQAEPAIAALKLPTGPYRQFRLVPHRIGGGAEEEDSTNFMVAGSVGADSATARRFILELDLEDAIDFLDSTGVVPKADSLNRIVLSLKVDGWFTGVDMEECLDGEDAEPDSSGAIHIRGNESCSGIGRRMGDKVDSSGEVEEEEETEKD